MNTNDETSIFGPADVISSYTRVEALADGVLVALPLASRFGFRVPVAITAAGHGSAIAWDEEDQRCREIEGMREAAVLQSALHAAKALTRRQNAGEPVERPDRIDFTVECIANDGGCRVVTVPLYMTISGGDSGEAIGTIMLIGED